jgi:hypothetical protein
MLPLAGHNQPLNSGRLVLGNDFNREIYSPVTELVKQKMEVDGLQ